MIEVNRLNEQTHRMTNMVSGLLNDLSSRSKSAISQMEAGDATVTAEKVIDSWRAETIEAIQHFKNGALQKFSHQ